MSTWIETSSARTFDLSDPQPEDICIDDIAHALANLCRWTGHCRIFYSVAEHSIHVSHLVPAQDALWGLLHDAAEAYVGDVSSPLKAVLGTAYRVPYKQVEKAIKRHFNLGEFPDSVKVADAQMLWHEKLQLLSPRVKWERGDELEKLCADVKLPVLQLWSPREAEEAFLQVYEQLIWTGEIR